MTIETPQTSTPTPTPTPALEASAAAIPAPDPAAAERATARAKRIAAAVERGKREYQPEHAYTERGWFLETEAAGPSKADRQRVEYAATHRLVFPASTSESEEGGEIQEARRALADILACTPKPASLPRELVATGARAAILAGDAEAAITLARAGRTHWRQPGMAVVCSSALEYAGELEATHPLLAATAEGVHYPILLALSALLAKIDDNNTRDLAGVLSALADSRAWAFSRPLFSDDKVRPGGSPAGADALRTKLVGLDRAVLAERLRTDRRVLDGALGRVARTLGGSEEEPEAVSGERVERGVREL